MQIKDYLYQRNMHLPISKKKLRLVKEIGWDSLNRESLGVVWLTFAHNIMFKIMKEKTTGRLMSALSNMYESPLRLTRFTGCNFSFT